jgi:uridine kinase
MGCSCTARRDSGAGFVRLSGPRAPRPFAFPIPSNQPPSPLPPPPPPSQIPTYDFVAHRRAEGVTTRIRGRETAVVILDGIFVLWAERVRAVCDVTIFTVEDADVCLARRLRRDIVERGRTVESVLAQYLRHVKPGFTQFVAPSMSLADFIIPRARENATAIAMLARDIQRRVDGVD